MDRVTPTLQQFYFINLANENEVLGCKDGDHTSALFPSSKIMNRISKLIIWLHGNIWKPDKVYNEITLKSLNDWAGCSLNFDPSLLARAEIGNWIFANRSQNFASSRWYNFQGFSLIRKNDVVELPFSVKNVNHRVSASKVSRPLCTLNSTRVSIELERVAGFE